MPIIGEKTEQNKSLSCYYSYYLPTADFCCETGHFKYCCTYFLWSDSSLREKCISPENIYLYSSFAQQNHPFQDIL
jgi:hypothetical protein